MSAQLDLLFAQSLRGSEPVQNRSEPTASSSEEDQSSSETSENINGFAVRNRLGNSSTIPAGLPVPYYVGRDSGTDRTPDPAEGREETRSSGLSSPPPLRGGHAEEPVTGAGIEEQAAGTGSEPAREQLSLRPYQAGARLAIDAEFDKGVKRTLLVLPTGTGKTVVFAALVRGWANNGDRTLVLAHRTELLDQAAGKLAAFGLGVSIDQATRRGSLESDVVVASVQTLRGARLERYAPDVFQRIVVDEGHHAAAASYRAIVDRFPAARVLLVTATPDRGDGKALAGVCDSVAFTYDMRQAIRDEWLVPLRARRVLVADMDLSSVKTHHGDFDQGELAAILASEKNLQGVAGPLLQLAGTRKTLVFGVDVAHAHGLAEVLNRHRPGCALALDGTAPRDQRRATLELFSRGAFQFLVNCALFTEGFDEPSVQCVAMARPTCSRALYTQMVGRGTRLLGHTLAESIRNGKPELLVLDFVGNSGRHRLVGPADALAGVDLDEEIREAVEKELDGGQAELETVLAHAEAELWAKRNRRALIVLSEYRLREVNPFIGDRMPKLDPNSPAAREPASSAQLEALKKWGFSDPPPGLSKGEASAMLDGIVARDKAGLSSLAQIRILRKSGLDATRCTKQRATQLFIIAKARGFKAWALRDQPEWTGKTKW